jgi:hypothetical protein
LASFQTLSIAFHTDDAPVIGSLTRCTRRRLGQTTASTLLLIQVAFGGSWNRRWAQRQVGRLVAWRSEASSASMACGCIGPMITAVIWLRSISATGTSAFSGPGCAHVGVKDAQRVLLAPDQGRALDHRQRAQRRLLAQVQPLDRPAPRIGQGLDHGRGPDAHRIEQGDHRRRRLEVGAGVRKMLADRLGGGPDHDQVAQVPSMIWPRSFTSVAMLSMIAVAANRADRPGCRRSRASSSDEVPEQRSQHACS